jgi:hypothetical protein
MSVVKVEAFGGDSVSRADKVLAGIPDGVQKAIKAAMPRAVSYLRSQSVDRIRERYAISAANIRANENVRVTYTLGGLVASVRFSGTKIPLYRFDGTSPTAPTYDTNHLVRGLTPAGWKMLPTSKAPRAHQLVGTSPTLFEHAFIATMQSGHTGIFERDGAGIQQLMGSSVAQMVGNEEVQQKLVQDASDKFEERMEHEISRLLNSWGT